MIFTTAQITGKPVVTYRNGWWEWHCASGTFKKYTKNALYLYNTENDILNLSLDFIFHYLSTCHTILYYVYTGGSPLSQIFWEHENLSSLSIIQLI